jgi:hypothetical protein
VEKLSAEQQSEIEKSASLVGDKRRAETLTAKRRSEIAKKAAAARWGKKKA